MTEDQKIEVIIAACVQLNRGAPCCIGKIATTCGHQSWNLEFGLEIIQQYEALRGKS